MIPTKIINKGGRGEGRGREERRKEGSERGEETHLTSSTTPLA